MSVFQSIRRQIAPIHPQGYVFVAGFVVATLVLGWLWAPLISATELIAGPMLALGLFTRAACVPLVLFLIITNFERYRVGRYFWNKLGLEYTMMWLVATIYFLIHGGGPYSLDRLIGWQF